MKKTRINSSALTLVLASAVSMAGAIATFPAQAQDAAPHALEFRLQERTQLRIHEPDQASDALRLQQREQLRERARVQTNKPSDQAAMWRRGPGFGPDAVPGAFAGPGYGAGGSGGAGGRGR